VALAGNGARDDAVVDLVGERLVSAALAGESDSVSAVDTELADLAGAAQRGVIHAPLEEDRIWLAEARGAFAALRWMARLFAEQLVGPELVAHDTHAARMLAAVVRRPGLTNSELMEMLGTDKTQVSRTGRTLTTAGLAAASRVGKSNSWRATAKGLAAARAIDNSTATSASIEGMTFETGSGEAETVDAGAGTGGTVELLLRDVGNRLSDELYPILRREGPIFANVESHGRGLTFAVFERALHGTEFGLLSGALGDQVTKLSDFRPDKMIFAETAKAVRAVAKRSPGAVAGRSSAAVPSQAPAKKSAAASKLPTKKSAAKRAAVKKAATKKTAAKKVAGKAPSTATAKVRRK